MWYLNSRTKALAVALGLIAVAFGYRYFHGRPGPISYSVSSLPALQEPGTEHSHISFLISINGEPLDFSDDAFMGLNERVHLHDNAGFFIHKHAKGVTLLYFLSTLGIKLTRDCITVAPPAGSGVTYCTDEKTKLTILVNRSPLPGNLDYYEMHNNDKILIDYSNADEVQLLLEANSIPDLPDDLSQHG